MKLAYQAMSVVMVLMLLVGWYCIAANYDYGMLAGTYTFREHGITSKIRLRSDSSFHQEVTTNGKTIVSDGKWRRIGEGGVVFKNLLQVPGAKTAKEQFGAVSDSPPDEQFYGHFEKVLGIYPELLLNGGPTFYLTSLLR